MARYSLDYSYKNSLPNNPRKKWGNGLGWSIGLLMLLFFFFGGISTVLRLRKTHLSLLKEHHILKISYDSLHSAKRQSDRQLESLKLRLQK
jgi:hypothetical protein